MIHLVNIEMFNQFSNPRIKMFFILSANQTVAQSKQETLESQTIRLRANYEESQKRITELNSQNAQLIAEATEQARTIEKLNTSLASCQRAQSIAESVGEDHKRALEEEIKVC